MNEAQHDLERLVKDRARLLDENARLREERAALIEEADHWRSLHEPKIQAASAACEKLLGDNARLLGAIKRWSIAVKTTPLKSTMEQETECFQAARDLHEIAREGR